MDTSLSRGKELFDLCRAEENKFVEIKWLLESLTEEQRREVVRYRHREYHVSEFEFWIIRCDDCLFECYIVGRLCYPCIGVICRNDTEL